MEDLIRKSALLKALEEDKISIYSHVYAKVNPADADELEEELEWIINIQPTVDAKPVVHGRWIYGKQHDDFVEAKCSVCETLLLVKWYDKLSEYNYCQHCGARMDGE